MGDRPLPHTGPGDEPQLDELISLIAHELRGPLNAITGWAHILHENVQGSALVEQAVETISRNTRLQEQLIDELLDVSRIASGRLAVSREPIRPGEPVRVAVDALRAAAESKGVRLEAEIDGDVQLFGDTDRLQQVARILLENALKFTPAGGSIRLQLARRDDWVELAVADDGIGLDAASLPRVFDRFWQAVRPLQRRGLGVGLTIARHVVELHGGGVEAESAGLGLGARFVARLPVLADGIDTAGTEPSSQSRVSTAAAPATPHGR